MLTIEENEIAALNNLENWDWDLYPAYPMPKSEAEAVLKVLQLRKAQKMMDSLRNS